MESSSPKMLCPFTCCQMVPTPTPSFTLWISPKISPKISLTEFAALLSFGGNRYSFVHNNFLAQPLTFWGIHEVDFPEGANVRPPGDSCAPVEAFLLIPWNNQISI